MCVARISRSDSGSPGHTDPLPAEAARGAQGGVRGFPESLVDSATTPGRVPPGEGEIEQRR
jgi:hypothetical protein